MPVTESKGANGTSEAVREETQIQTHSWKVNGPSARKLFRALRLRRKLQPVHIAIFLGTGNASAMDVTVLVEGITADIGNPKAEWIVTFRDPNEVWDKEGEFKAHLSTYIPGNSLFTERTHGYLEE